MRVLAFLAAMMLLCLVRQHNAFAAEPVAGKAAVYSDAYHGKKTASGEVYDKNELSAASNVFPLGSYVHVKHRINGKHVVVRINDTQAKSNKHILDLSSGAARKLGETTGHIPVDAHIVKSSEKEVASETKKAAVQEASKQVAVQETASETKKVAVQDEANETKNSVTKEAAQETDKVTDKETERE